MLPLCYAVGTSASQLPCGEGLFSLYTVSLRHAAQEILICRKDHIMYGVVVAQQNAGIIFGILECDTIAIQGHLMVARVVVEP